MGPGETVWQIAESCYGSGLFWPVIEKANPGMVSKGNFIVCAMGLKIAQIEVVSVPALVPDMCNCRAPTAANKPAKTVLYPTMEYDLSKTAEVTTGCRCRG